MLMERQFVHSQLPRIDSNDRARQDFVKRSSSIWRLASCPTFSASMMTSGSRLPKAQWAPPADKHEVASLMNGEPHYRMWEALYRTGSGVDLEFGPPRPRFATPRRLPPRAGA